MAQALSNIDLQQMAPVATRETNPRLVTILPRGESMRNFVYTGALDQVSESVDLSILSVLPNEKFRELLVSRYEDVKPLLEKEERYVVRFLREILDLAHGRWLWSEAAKMRWRLREHEAKEGFGPWLKRNGKKLIAYPLANRPCLERLALMEQKAGCKYCTSEYIEYFRAKKPSLVFNSSHVHSVVAIQAIRAAQKLGIPTATFLFSWDNLTSQGRIIPPYDYYIVWSERIRKDLLSIYPKIRPEQVFVTGTPQFDFHFRPEYYWSREEFCKYAGADPNRPIVLYATGMARQQAGEPEIVERIADMLKEMKQFGPPQLLVRVYPKDRSGRFEALKQRRKDILFPSVPWEPAWLSPTYEDSYVLTNTIRHSAVGINVASTVSLELCMFDKPVINVGYNPPNLDISPINLGDYYSFDHYKPVVDSAAITVAWSEDEMRQQLLHALAHPEERRAERKALLDLFFGNTLDGKSSARVASVLIELSRKCHQLPNR